MIRSLYRWVFTSGWKGKNNPTNWPRVPGKSWIPGNRFLWIRPNHRTFIKKLEFIVEINLLKVKRIFIMADISQASRRLKSDYLDLKRDPIPYIRAEVWRTISQYLWLTSVHNYNRILAWRWKRINLALLYKRSKRNCLQWGLLLRWIEIPKRLSFQTTIYHYEHT